MIDVGIDLCDGEVTVAMRDRDGARVTLTTNKRAAAAFAAALGAAADADEAAEAEFTIRGDLEALK